MERTANIEKAKEIMGNNFIGPEELKCIENKMGIKIPEEVFLNPPIIHFEVDLLERNKEDYILFLGSPYFKDTSELTIVKMREHFGYNPIISEPCFYNQDWYLNEPFAKDSTFKLGWYLIKKNVFENQRGKVINQIKNDLNINIPNAILCTYLFFCWYLIKNEILWENDFFWTNEIDANGDHIYIGRYVDLKRINKNGWNIHRHLSITKQFSIIEYK